jgi:hypothetical protein
MPSGLTAGGLAAALGAAHKTRRLAVARVPRPDVARIGGRIRSGAVGVGETHGRRILHGLDDRVGTRDLQQTVKRPVALHEHHATLVEPTPPDSRRDLAQAARVHELELADVDQQKLRSLGLELLQAVVEVPRAAEVEYTAQ